MDKVICINLTNVLSATFNIITNDTFTVLFHGRGGEGEGDLGKFLLWYVPLASQIPYPIMVYFVTKIHFWANM